MCDRLPGIIVVEFINGVISHLDYSISIGSFCSTIITLDVRSLRGQSTDNPTMHNVATVIHIITAAIL